MFYVLVSGQGEPLEMSPLRLWPVYVNETVEVFATFKAAYARMKG